MANEGGNLSTRTSAEAQNRYQGVMEAAGELFTRYKMDIAGAINKPFPFFQLLRDRGFITREMYEASQENCKKWFSVEEVTYDILCELDKRFDLPLLEAIFSKFIMEKYPDLKHTYRIFRKGIPHIKNFLEIEAEENERLEQGPGENSHQCLPWSSPLSLNYNGAALPDNGLSEHSPVTEEINANETGTTSDNSNALEIQQATEQCVQESEPAVINSEDSEELKNREEHPTASTSGLKRKPGTVDPENNSTPEKSRKRIRTRQQPGAPVDFDAEILPVTCGEIRGNLIKRKFQRGAARKCIRSDDGTWLTPREFEIKGDRQKSNNWKISVCCNGKPLKQLIEKGFVPQPPRKYGREKRVGNSDKCTICQDGDKLLRCDKCRNCFHAYCHIPPVNTERKNWNCTFCTIRDSLRSQQHHKESEVLAEQMGPEMKLKCEFLLLKVYHQLEGIIFPDIPHENYVREASQCLQKLKMLDEIKKKLNDGNYHKVEDFMKAMNEFFTVPRCNDSDFTGDDFKKNFKEVFAIQETN